MDGYVYSELEFELKSTAQQIPFMLGTLMFNTKLGFFIYKVQAFYVVVQ